MIPLCQLKASKINVRKTGPGAEIDALAASIDALGLLENLIVVPASGGDSALYDVAAGGRRLQALKLLARRKRLARDTPIPCLVRGKDEALELSLAENFERVPLHPADQFEAFSGLVARGQSAADIAARFGIATAFVEQRLKLASVSPRLIAEHRKGEMTFEQLMAFTVANDHQAQESVWFDLPYRDISPDTIRRHLTASQIATSDRRVRFVGTDAYEAAGGVVLRDLFDATGGGYLEDSRLLDRLVAEKLEEEANAIRSEGWQWVEVRPDADYVWLNRFRRAKTVTRELGNADRRCLARLRQDYDRQVAELDESGGGWTGELDRLAEEIARLEAKAETWPEEEIARAGAVVTLNAKGALEVTRGLVARQTASPTSEKSAEPRPPGVYPDSVLADLSAHRTAALRECLAANPEAAFLELLRALVLQLLFPGAPQGCLAIAADEVLLDRSSRSVGVSPAAEAFGKRHEAWLKRLPEIERLPEWLAGLSGSDRLCLLAHCVALTVNTLHGAMQRNGTEADCARLAGTLGLDMAAWWRPTRENFLNRLTKAQIMTAVSEGVSPLAGRRLADFKKDELVDEAERLLKDTQWLPLVLRPVPSEGFIAA
jgi:ParB family chromosome partitioning protein